jgi:hypothetical protein
MSNFIKNFVDWFNLKPKIDAYNHNPPLYKENELWWCSIGENIGTETSGKSKGLTRPVVIYKKLSKYTFLGVPVTSQILDSHGKKRAGSWYCEISVKGKTNLAILSQIRILDYRRLDKKIIQVDRGSTCFTTKI